MHSLQLALQRLVGKGGWSISGQVQVGQRVENAVDAPDTLLESGEESSPSKSTAASPSVFELHDAVPALHD